MQIIKTGFIVDYISDIRYVYSELWNFLYYRIFQEVICSERYRIKTDEAIYSNRSEIRKPDTQSFLKIANLLFHSQNENWRLTNEMACLGSNDWLTAPLGKD